MNKLLSIIIPTYNMEQYLTECLDSLIVDEALLPCLEVLVILDGCTDRSEEISQQYARKYPQTFRVISKENGNYGSCVNRGIDEAKGKYIKTLDADDRFDTEVFQSFLEQLGTVDADMIISDYVGWNMQTGHKDEFEYHLPHPRTFSVEELNFKHGVPLMMHASAYRTEMLREIGYRQSEGIFYTDQEWIFMPAASAKTFWYFPQKLYYYRVGREGQTVNINVWVHHADEEIYGLKKMCEYYKSAKEHASDAAIAFMEYRLECRTEAIYRHIFIRSIDAIDDHTARDFDQYVTENLPSIAVKMGTLVSYRGRNIIDLWRKHPLLYRAFVLTRKLANRSMKSSTK